MVLVEEDQTVVMLRHVQEDLDQELNHLDQEIQVLMDLVILAEQVDHTHLKEQVVVEELVVEELIPLRVLQEQVVLEKVLHQYLVLRHNLFIVHQMVFMLVVVVEVLLVELDLEEIEEI